MSNSANSLKNGESFGRALVTGATGLIGRFLVKQLVEEGVQVNALVRPTAPCQEALGGLGTGQVRLFEGDLRNQGAVERAAKGVEVAFHAGGKVHSIPRNRREAAEFFDVNVQGTKNVLKACQGQPLRAFVFFSTIAVYGAKATDLLTEEMGGEPQGPYAKSKYEAEQAIAQFFALDTVRPVILRLALVYGEGDRGNFVRMIRGIDRGRFVFIGDGQAKKSMAYVENVVDAALLAARSPKARGETFNVADASPYPLNQVVETVARELGVSAPRLRIPASWMRAGGHAFDLLGTAFRFRPPFTASDVTRLTRDTACSISKIRAAVGFEPKVNLEQGVARTVRWYLEEQPRRRKGQ